MPLRARNHSPSPVPCLLWDSWNLSNPRPQLLQSQSHSAVKRKVTKPGKFISSPLHFHAFSYNTRCSRTSSLIYHIFIDEGSLGQTGSVWSRKICRILQVTLKRLGDLTARLGCASTLGACICAAIEEQQPGVCVTDSHRAAEHMQVFASNLWGTDVRMSGLNCHSLSSSFSPSSYVLRRL